MLQSILYTKEYLYLICLLTMMLYFPCNKYLTWGRIYKTSWDDSIPLLKFFIYPYLSFFPFMSWFLYTVSFLSISAVQEVVSTLIFAAMVSYLTFIFFPTYVEEYKIEGKDLASILLRGLYANDERNNAFPSGHIFFSLIIALFCLKWSLLSWPVLMLIILPIWASTVFIKQHYLPDLFGGIYVGLVSYGVSQFIFA